MSTEADFIAYVHEQAGFGADLVSKKMFGEYGIYFDGRIVAVAADNSLFLKPTDAGRALLPTVVEAQPWPEAKPWFVLDEFLDDTELLQRLIRATAGALPAPGASRPQKAGNATPAKKPRQPGKGRK
jgi:TfoX/Sxy family transcriptional regulator of competence genes